MGLEQFSIRLGMVTVSRAGRDAGSHYVVVRVIDQRLVALADGRIRTAANPKRKNLRHVEPIGLNHELAAKLERGERISDSDVRQALAAYETGG